MSDSHAVSAEQARALAERVLHDRLRRYVVVGVTPKGRIIAEPRGEPTEAELEWEALCREARTGRS